MLLGARSPFKGAQVKCQDWGNLGVGLEGCDQSVRLRARVWLEVRIKVRVRVRRLEFGLRLELGRRLGFGLELGQRVRRLRLGQGRLDLELGLGPPSKQFRPLEALIYAFVSSFPASSLDKRPEVLSFCLAVSLLGKQRGPWQIHSYQKDFHNRKHGLMFPF